MASRHNRFDAQISQTDEVLFCLGVCRRSAENGERASLKSVTKIQHPKMMNRKKKINKKKKKNSKKKKKKKKKKKCQPQRIKDMTPRVHLDESVGR